jgi:hypothetical protein
MVWSSEGVRKCGGEFRAGQGLETEGRKGVKMRRIEHMQDVQGQSLRTLCVVLIGIMDGVQYVWSAFACGCGNLPNDVLKGIRDLSFADDFDSDTYVNKTMSFGVRKYFVETSQWQALIRSDDGRGLEEEVVKF